MEHQIPILETG